MINRRTLLTTALTLGAMKAFPGLSYAQARPLVFATFTGSWEEAHKAVLVPAFRKANADASIVLDPMLSVDQIAKVNAARANPPACAPFLDADKSSPARLRAGIEVHPWIASYG